MDPTEHQELCNLLSASKNTLTIWLIVKKKEKLSKKSIPNFVQVFVNILYGSKKYDFFGSESVIIGLLCGSASVTMYIPLSYNATTVVISLL